LAFKKIADIFSEKGVKIIGTKFDANGQNLRAVFETDFRAYGKSWRLRENWRLT
jgi:hypothetical protein